MTTSALRELPKSESFRITLRRATRVEHASLDAHPALAGLVDGTLSLAGYARLMSLFHAFYARHDAMLEEGCDVHELDRQGFRYTRRSSVLAADLSALGVVASHASNARPAPLPPIESAGTLVGYLYVLEGSILGGGVLLSAAETLLRERASAGLGYWQWCHDEGAARWRMTCGTIEKVALAENARLEMIAAAKQAFATFSSWLEPWRDDALHDATWSLARC